MFRSAAAQRLAERLSGPVLGPDDDGYAAEVAGFNQVMEHRPAIVAGVRDAAEVREAVAFGAATGTPMAVQATGHGPSTAAHGTGRDQGPVRPGQPLPVRPQHPAAREEFLTIRKS